MKRKTVAVIGAGYWGKNLIRNYEKLKVLHSICDLSPERLLYFKALYPEVEITDNYHTILNNPDIQQLVIATPTRFHYELAKKALLAKKDVFVEKAMCESFLQAQELVELAEKYHRILMVGHLLHYHPAIIKIKNLLQENVLGELYHLSFSRMNFGSNGEEKSALWAFAPHDLSLLFSFVPYSSLKNFEAKHKSFFSRDFIDHSWLHFEFEHNISADIEVGWANPCPERKLILRGSKGMLVFDDLKELHQKIEIFHNQIQVQPSSIQFDFKNKSCVTFEPREPLENECLHFLSCCESRIKPLTDGEEGLNVIKILEEAKSFREKNHDQSLLFPLVLEDLVLSKEKL